MKIFFDLDGTLIDTSERHYRVYKEILIESGIRDILSKDEFWNRKRMGERTIELLPPWLSERYKKIFMNKWIERIEEKRYLRYDFLIKEAEEVLNSLSKKFSLFLVTLRNKKGNLLWQLKDLRIDSFFKEVIIGSPLIKKRSKSYLIKEFISDSNIIIGDSEIDIFTGKELKLVTVAVTYGIRSEDFLKNLKPDFILNSLKDVNRVLDKFHLDKKLIHP